MRKRRSWFERIADHRRSARRWSGTRLRLIRADVRARLPQSIEHARREACPSPDTGRAVRRSVPGRPCGRGSTPGMASVSARWNRNLLMCALSNRRRSCRVRSSARSSRPSSLPRARVPPWCERKCRTLVRRCTDGHPAAFTPLQGKGWMASERGQAARRRSDTSWARRDREAISRTPRLAHRRRRALAETQLRVPARRRCAAHASGFGSSRRAFSATTFIFWRSAIRKKLSGAECWRSGRASRSG